MQLYRKRHEGIRPINEENGHTIQSMRMKGIWNIMSDSAYAPIFTSLHTAYESKNPPLIARVPAAFVNVLVYDSTLNESIRKRLSTECT